MAINDTVGFQKNHLFTMPVEGLVDTTPLAREVSVPARCPVSNTSINHSWTSEQLPAISDTPKGLCDDPSKNVASPSCNLRGRG
jgi:hypothetical protein